MLELIKIIKLLFGFGSNFLSPPYDMKAICQQSEHANEQK